MCEYCRLLQYSHQIDSNLDFYSPSFKILFLSDTTLIPISLSLILLSIQLSNHTYL